MSGKAQLIFNNSSFANILIQTDITFGTNEFEVLFTLNNTNIPDISAFLANRAPLSTVGYFEVGSSGVLSTGGLYYSSQDQNSGNYILTSGKIDLGALSSPEVINYMTLNFAFDLNVSFTQAIVLNGIFGGSVVTLSGSDITFTLGDGQVIVTPNTGDQTKSLEVNSWDKNIVQESYSPTITAISTVDDFLQWNGNGNIYLINDLHIDISDGRLPMSLNNIYVDGGYSNNFGCVLDGMGHTITFQDAGAKGKFDTGLINIPAQTTGLGIVIKNLNIDTTSVRSGSSTSGEDTSGFLLGTNILTQTAVYFSYINLYSSTESNNLSLVGTDGETYSGALIGYSASLQLILTVSECCFRLNLRSDQSGGLASYVFNLRCDTTLVILGGFPSNNSDVGGMIYHPHDFAQFSQSIVLLEIGSQLPAGSGGFVNNISNSSDFTFVYECYFYGGIQDDLFHTTPVGCMFGVINISSNVNIFSSYVYALSTGVSTPFGLVGNNGGTLFVGNVAITNDGSISSVGGYSTSPDYTNVLTSWNGSSTSVSSWLNQQSSGLWNLSGGSERPRLNNFINSRGWINYSSANSTTTTLQLTGLCLLKGSKILKVSSLLSTGDSSPIEDLKIGDKILVFSPSHSLQRSERIITKIVKYTLFGRESNIPYVIPKDFFGHNTPEENIYLSGSHAIFVNNKFRHPHCSKLFTREYSFIGKIFEYYHISFDDYPLLISCSNLLLESCGIDFKEKIVNECSDEECKIYLKGEE